MKIFARQIPPEYQESPLFFGDWPEKVICCGNASFKRHTTELYDRITEAYDDAAYYYQEMAARPHLSHCKNITNLANDFFPPHEYRGRSYSDQDLHKIRQALELYGTRAYYQGEHIPAMLEAITGEAWERATIRGCCQSDWQEIIYPSSYGREWLKAFETEYFNAGTEWIVHDGNAEPETPDDIDGFSVYAHGWSDEQIKTEIAEAYGTPGAEVILYKIAGQHLVYDWEAV